VAVQLLGLTELWRFDREFIARGQVWLLLSGNLAHLNWNHLLLNIAGLILVAVFFSAYMPVAAWLTLSLWSALLVGLGLYYFNPQLFWYVGLSGMLHGLFVVGAWYESRHFSVSGLVLLALITLKLLWEQWSGALPGSEAMAGGRVVVDAHLYGAIAGVVFLLVRVNLLSRKS
jgi:rhomboid family GlyGly-CTERM serine protease